MEAVSCLGEFFLGQRWQTSTTTRWRRPVYQHTIRVSVKVSTVHTCL